MDVKWIYEVLACCFLGLVTSQDFTFKCGDGCRISNNAIEGNAGEDIQIIFTFTDNNDKTFMSLQLSFNGSSIFTVYRYPNVRFIKEKVYDPRFIIPDNLISDGDKKTVIEMTFKNLSLQEDNGKAFAYVIDFRQGVGHEERGSKILNVFDGPRFCESPASKYEVKEGNVYTVGFSLCGNPKPTVVVKFGSRVIGVTEIDAARPENATRTYKYDYKAVLDQVNRDQCGDALEFNAVGHKTEKFTSDIKLLFTPDTPENVEIDRDVDNVLTVTWSQLVYGVCPVRYHVRHTKNGNTEATRTFDLTMLFKNASGNNSIAVNAEVNGRQGAYSEPKSIDATVEPTKTKQVVTEEDSGFALGYIIAIVLVVVLIICIIVAICIVKRKKEKKPGNSGYDVDMQPLSTHAGGNEPENNYSDVENFVVQRKPQDQMIYAELGPGGGRTGQKPMVEESNYAEVKTDGVHYPNLQQSSHYQPQVYDVVTRSKPPSKSNDDDDVSFDYESSVVV